jgi:hypothetical protein
MRGGGLAAGPRGRGRRTGLMHLQGIGLHPRLGGVLRRVRRRQGGKFGR